MSIYAAANIAQAVKNFGERGYAKLGGVILNKRGVENEEERVNEFVREISSSVVGTINFDPTVQKAEREGKTVVELFPQSGIAAEYEKVAETMLSLCEKGQKNV
jgi:nitrogenase iron protein NifH